MRIRTRIEPCPLLFRIFFNGLSVTCKTAEVIFFENDTNITAMRCQIIDFENDHFNFDHWLHKNKLTKKTDKAKTLPMSKKVIHNSNFV